MKKLIALLAAAFILPASAADFPEGSPKFLHNYHSALDTAKKENKPAILVFSAVWCPPCVEMKKSVYPSKEVAPYKDKFVWAYLDLDEEATVPLVERYGVQIYPTIVFVDGSGKPLGAQTGGATAGDFANTLGIVLKKAGH